jgi:protein SCO1
MRTLRVALWVLVGLAAIGAAILMLDPFGWRSRLPQPQVTAVSLGGPFTLTGADGKTFSSTRLAGKPYAIFFGFTHCPDVCPTTLARLVRLRRELPGGDRAMEIVFVTVDPERDGPREVGAYASLFDAPVIGLTGTPDRIEQVKKAYGIFSQKVPDGSGGDSVDHTATVLLFGRDGKLSGTIAPDEPDATTLAKLKHTIT